MAAGSGGGVGRAGLPGIANTAISPNGVRPIIVPLDPWCTS